mmetsp:Transcript_1551/g.1357  ORF Transcript_1551/g.1357 Transcript_1551/m.1357 type:complete len:110 (+) Transcript_1551:157-486(+)
MTPRILMEREKKDNATPVKMNKEINFTESLLKHKLSPEHIAIVHQLTNNRRKEIQERENQQSPKVIEFRLDSPGFNTQRENKEVTFDEILISQREERRKEIMERLDNLL